MKVRLGRSFRVLVAMVVIAGSPCWGAASIFTGSSESFISNDMPGDIILRGPGNTPARSVGTADVTVALENGAITFQEISAVIESATWTGAGQFVDPVTFQTRNISLSVTTDPTSFTITTSTSLPLSSNPFGSLEWMTPRPPEPAIVGNASPIVFSGSYTLTGPTETVLGSFSHTLGLRDIGTDGTVSVASFPDEIALTGGLAAFFGMVRVPIVDDQVDGIPIFVEFSSIRSGRGASFGNNANPTALSAIPEPSVAMLSGLALLLSLRRSRRA